MNPERTPARHAIILAAGRGSRLEPEEGHKLLVSIEGTPLLDYHLEHFRTLGVSDVTVVTGYRHEALEEALVDWETPESMEIHTALNPEFDASNGLSVLAGVRAGRRSEEVADPVPFWLTMSDHLFEPQFSEVVRDAFPDRRRDSLEGLLTVDFKIDSIFDLPDANKVELGPGRGGHRPIEQIGKTIDSYDCIDTGCFWCDRGFVEALEAEREARGDATTSDAVRRLSDRESFYFLDVGDCLWQDIDTPEARAYAEQLVRHDWRRHDDT